MTDPLVQEVRRRYRGAKPGPRAHTWFRSISCPFAMVASAVPRQGRVLEVGCGHGFATLYLALDGPGRSVHGVDIDGSKIDVARAAGAGVSNLSFDRVETTYLPSGSWECVVIVDVLYLLGPDRAMEMIDAAAEAIAPGGSVIVKEIDFVPRWKYRLARAQELLATKVFHITEGEGVSFVAPVAIESRLQNHGLSTSRTAVDHGSPWPHAMIRGTR